MEMKVFSVNMISQELMNQSSSLFSNHYGIWSSSAPPELVGKRVRLNNKRMKEMLLWDNDSCFMVGVFLLSGELIGHAFYCLFPFNQGKGGWITQLVVHSEHRNKKVATNMIERVWRDNNLLALGVVSSHPYSIKAVQTASNNLCIPDTTLSKSKEIVAASGVPYIQNKNIKVSPNESIIQTDFRVDHTGVDSIVSLLLLNNNWRLRRLEEGDEYLCIVIKD